MRVGKLIIQVSFLTLLTSCFHGGEVETNLTKDVRPVVETPPGFLSPQKEIEEAWKKVEAFRQTLPQNINFNSRAWKQYVGLEQWAISLGADQDRIAEELSRNGELTLEPGKSYSFILESFCVHSGKSRPVEGDGFQVGPLQGAPKDWLPTILREYKKLKIPQQKTQKLIWALLYDVHFDDLGREDQRQLTEIYPDAPFRFSNRATENEVKSFWEWLLPPKVKENTAQVQEFKNMIVDPKISFEELENKLAPISSRQEPVPVGWLKMPEGYLLRLESPSGHYSTIKADIYVPPQIRDAKFTPPEWIALPEKGQRLAMSPNPKPEERPTPKWSCDQVKNAEISHCQAMTEGKRGEILKFANPINFPHTRYASPPDRSKSFREETDCSTFVYEVYRYSGFDYPFSTTSALGCVPSFKEAPRDQGLPGDLVLFKSHVGILTKDGKVVSSTSGGSEERSKLPIDNPRFLPSIREYSTEDLGMGEGRILKWTCP